MYRVVVWHAPWRVNSSVSHEMRKPVPRMKFLVLQETADSGEERNEGGERIALVWRLRSDEKECDSILVEWCA